MELVTFKEENSIDYGESTIESLSVGPANDITEYTKGREILKLQRKKCGEIFIYDEDMFDILCTLCKTPALFEEIERFFVHIKCSHKEENWIDKSDPLEAQSEDNFNENIKPEPISDLNVFKNDEDEIKATRNSEKNSNSQSLAIACQNDSNHNTKNKLLEKSEPNGNDYKRRRTKNNVGSKVKKLKSIETQDETKKQEDVSCSMQETQDIENDSLKCKYCGRRLADSSTLIEHERIHTGERPCQCQICGKQFRTRSCVWRHEKIHSNVRKFECDKCTLSFKSKAGLNAHMLRHGEKTIPCSYCDKLFHLKAAKLEHERVHTGEKPYQCNFCGKCFQTGGHLNRHSRTHTGIKPYKCPHCDRSFATKAILDNHIVIHTGERPFICTTCNATFPRKKALKSHEKIHSDYRGYVCKICGEAFKQYPTLHGHMKSHRKVLTKTEGF